MSWQCKRCLRIGPRRWWCVPFFCRLGHTRTPINDDGIGHGSCEGAAAVAAVAAVAHGDGVGLKEEKRWQHLREALAEEYTKRLGPFLQLSQKTRKFPFLRIGRPDLVIDDGHDNWQKVFQVDERAAFRRKICFLRLPPIRIWRQPEANQCDVNSHSGDTSPLYEFLPEKCQHCVA